jgi:tripartite-type tricarboxylate transporter receptor subunit TctC
MHVRRRSILTAAAALPLATMPGRALPQGAWPNRPVRVIVPFPPGVPLDVILRVVAQRLGTVLGQPMVVENRAGAGGNIGIEAAARSAPDGYTLLGTASNFTANPSLYAKVAYDPLKDFVPVTGLIRTPAVLTVAADSPIRSVDDLIARTRAKPGGLAFASGGNGSLAHFAGELFKLGAGVDALHTPYKAAPDILNSLLARSTDFAFPVYATALTHIKAGKFRALAVTSQKRMAQSPDVPTMQEAMKSGGFDLESENGLVALAGTPPEIVARLNAEVVKILRDPAVAEPMVNAGYEMVGNSPAEFAARLRSDLAKYADLVKRTGAKVD